MMRRTCADVRMRPSSSHLRLTLLAALAAACVAVVVPATASPEGRAEQSPRLLSLSALGHWSGTIHDRVMPRGSRRLAASRLALASGGAYTTPTGETVNVYQSPAYPPNDQANQSLANFLDGLVHGSELSAVVVYVAPFSEVTQICGAEADACYFPSNDQLVIPGENPPDGAPLEEILTHEYGHHIANNRSNPPWDAGTWGTKRWATYEQICTRTAQGTAFPGDEGDHYTLNPAEAFAESYRQLNDDRGLTGGTLPWLIVDPSFRPDATAESLLALDVTSPWQRTVISTWSGTFSRPGAVSQRTLAPPYDGTLVVQVAAPRGARISLWNGSAALVGTSPLNVTTTVCGRQTYTVRVAGVRKGSFRVTVSQS